MALSSITVSGITPDLSILGTYQRFIFPNTLNSCTLGTKNTFLPTLSNNSITNLELMNNSLNGFRWVHTTTSGGTFGNLTLQSFIGPTPTNIWGTGEGGAFTFYLPIIFSNNINMGGFQINNLGTPTDPTSAVNKAYADSLPSQSITLTGAVTGTGTGTITTAFNGTVGVANGGTGNTTATPYSVICGGTISTGVLQSVASLGTTGQVLTSQGVGALPTWTSAAFCNILLSSATPTTITTANTYVKVNGTTTSSLSNLFTATSNRMTYNGTTPINIQVTLSVDWALSGGATLVSFAIFKNGGPITIYCSPITNTSTGNSQAIALACFFPMVVSDFIEVWATCGANGRTLTVTNMNFIATQI